MSRTIMKDNLIKHFNIDIDNLPYTNSYIDDKKEIIIYGFKIDLEHFTMQTTDRVLEFDEYVRMCNFIKDVKQELQNNAE